MSPINIVFFRNALRLHDNQALFHALKDKNIGLLPLVCIDPRFIDISLLNPKLHKQYTSPKTWFFKLQRVASPRTHFYYECVLNLKEQLKKKGTDLLILFGEPETLIPSLKTYLEKNDLQMNKLHTIKEYAYEELLVEKRLSKQFGNDIVFHHDTLMVHPDDLNLADDKTYKVFSHFRNRVLKMDTPVRKPLDIPPTLPEFPNVAWEFEHANQGQQYTMDLLENSQFKTDERSACPWHGGEQSALDRLHSYVFESSNADNYKHTRNGLIGTEYSTKFSAFLAHGCLSPRLIWHEMDRHVAEESKKRNHTVQDKGPDDGEYWIKFELLWRDFFRYLTIGFGTRIFMLHGFRNMENPALAKKDEKEHVDEKPKRKNSYTDKVWRSDDVQFDKWKTGQTGQPFIDACMRELLCTGFLNNRGRQNVASYLAKDLEIDWRIGAEYFETILIDHDVYSNYGNWQYVAGVGCDPREGFRHFNVMKQGKDYDPDGKYVRLWCPELKNVPEHYIFCPWLMSKDEQTKFKCKIGQDYPEPMAVFASWERHIPAAAKSGNHIDTYFAPSDHTDSQEKKKIKKE